MKKVAIAVLLVLVIVTLGAGGLQAARQIEVWSLYRLFYSYDPTGRPDDLLARFTKETKIEVNIQYIGRSNYDEAMEQIHRGNGPDVVIGDIEEEYLMPLDRFLDRWSDRRYMMPQFFSRDSRSGAVNGLPLSIIPYGVSYFKTYFRDAGLDARSAANSWEDLEAAVTKLTVGPPHRRAGMEAAWNGTLFECLLLQNGGRFISTDEKRSLLNSRAAVEALEFMAALFQASRPADHPVWSTYDWRFPLQSAMYYGTPTVGRQLADIAARGADILGAFAPKRCTSCQQVVRAQPYMYLRIPRTAGDSQSAWTFITWMLSRDNSALISGLLWNLPPRTDVQQQVAKAQPLLVDWYKMLPYATDDVYTGRAYESISESLYPRSQNRQNSLLFQVLRGELRADLILNQIHADFQSGIDASWRGW
jgi:ABC-type glycerol-3-phosphate transport system substrate-binding protein